MLIGCSVRAPHISSLFPQRYFPPPLTLRVRSPRASSIRAHCSSPRDERKSEQEKVTEKEREREREREDQALGPWRNQFKWLSVDVIDFHFTRLSGKMLLYRPLPPPSGCSLYLVSVPLSLSLSLLSLSLYASLPLACFVSSRRARRIRVHRTHKYAL